ncbi:hypothetical protein FGO68_gene13386 [Halteria grandinella]|uniref:Uncharacterized protein n=1 Tax=Halteria grandinella TaxID=5974 RepID=A0A8J8P222_HALGN|nr:hypothetical protein FGO68_gene13386 [Halteria grandinella]
MMKKLTSLGSAFSVQILWNKILRSSLNSFHLDIYQIQNSTSFKCLKCNPQFKTTTKFITQSLESPAQWIICTLIVANPGIKPLKLTCDIQLLKYLRFSKYSRELSRQYLFENLVSPIISIVLNLGVIVQQTIMEEVLLKQIENWSIIGRAAKIMLSQYYLKRLSHKDINGWATFAIRIQGILWLIKMDIRQLDINNIKQTNQRIWKVYHLIITHLQFEFQNALKY